MKTSFRIVLAALAATLASLAAPASAAERHVPYAARQVAPGPGDLVRMHRYADRLGRRMPHAYVHGRHYGYAAHRHPAWRAGYARPAYGWHRAPRLTGYGRPAWHRPYWAARRPLPVYAPAHRVVRSYPVAPYAQGSYGSYAPYVPVHAYGHGGAGYAASSLSRCGCSGGGLIEAIAGY